MKAWGNSNQNLYGSKLDQAVYRRVIVSFFSDAPFPTERVTVFLITSISSFPARMQFAGIKLTMHSQCRAALAPINWCPRPMIGG
jgi:hypothetical protein